MANRREETEALAKALLDDIEEQRLEPRQVALRASRLAAWIKDSQAQAWLGYEVSGYQDDFDSIDAAVAAGRLEHHYAQRNHITLSSLTSLKRLAEEASGGSNFEVEMAATRLIEAVLGTIHRWVSEKYLELAFGGAAESAFDVLRANVDAAIARLVPDAAQMFAAAFTNLESDNPEHWAHAASTCRRLLKEIADRLQPPTRPIHGHPMTDAHYRNRLRYWIELKDAASTKSAVMVADLDHLAERIGALDDAGHKGAHANVTKQEAARYIAGTYLLVDDILSLDPEWISNDAQRAVHASMALLSLDRDVTDDDVEALDDWLEGPEKD